MIARITVLQIAVVAMLGISAQAQAEPKDDFGSPGVYVGAGFVVGMNVGQAITDIFIDDFDQGNAVGFDVWLGYRFIPNLAAEVEFEYLNGFEPDEDFAEGLSVDTMTATGNLKVYLLTKRFQPFALVGVGVTDYRFAQGNRSKHESGFSARFGLGFDVYLTEHLALQAKASYVYTTGDISSLDYADVTIGAQFRF